MTTPRKKPQGNAPWWISDATEMCSACKQTYAFHTEIRCADCDEPVCPGCAQMTMSFEFSCPGCFEQSLRAAN